GAGVQIYRFNQAFYYGDPGCTMDHFEGAAAYVYASGNYAKAYQNRDMTANPAKELVRSILYIRDSDYIFVHDRAATTKAAYLKQLRWHFASEPALTGDAWAVTRGRSRLFGVTFSDTKLTTALNKLTDLGKPPTCQLT